MPFRIFLILFLILAITTCKQPSVSQNLPLANPQDVGLSSERLNRIQRYLNRHINDGKLPGAVTLIMRKGKIAHFQAIGKMDESKPMREDTIFRIASMTKPITSVAIMMLSEQGKLSIEEPVSNYISEFKDIQVGIRGNDNSLKVVPSKSPITIRHLLTHTSGITYRFADMEPWSALYKDAGISDGLSQTEGTIRDEVVKLTKLPLMHHPGETFTYGLSTDVLGYLVEVVSKMTLDKFFRQSIFEPLKMNDTYFYLPSEKRSRFASVYSQSPGGSIQRVGDDPVEEGNLVYSASYQYKGPQTYYSGGVGLVSTATDYARFLQMLLNGGELDGIRILSQNTIEQMTANQVPLLQNTRYGFGLGFGLFSDHSSTQYGWSGFFHTTFFVDPQEKLIGIFMSQMLPPDERLHARFRVLALESISD